MAGRIMFYSDNLFCFRFGFSLCEYVELVMPTADRRMVILINFIRTSKQSISDVL